MADFIQNDTGSTLRVQCSDKANGLLINLAGCVVRLKWKYQGVLLTRVMSIVDAITGKAEYKFVLGELQPTVKEFEIEITLSSGEVITSTDRIKVSIGKELV